MRIKNSAMVVIAASLCFNSAVFAADGTINFTGKITDTACEVTTANNTQTVSLGTVAATAFSAAGDTAAATKFTIQVSNCPANIGTASIRFDGTPTSDNRILALTAGSGVATNVGIGIYEADSATLIGLQKNSNPQTLKEGTNELNYVAKYYAIATGVTPGNADASTTFTITYQ